MTTLILPQVGAVANAASITDTRAASVKIVRKRRAPKYDPTMQKITKKRSAFPIFIEVNGFVFQIASPQEIPYNTPFKVIDITN